MSRSLSTEILVVGSGIAGLFFALRAARSRRVLLVTKKERPESSTNYAQGGIAAVFGADDSARLHAADTYVAGAGLCHSDAVTALVEEGPQRIRELIDIGVRFSLNEGALSLGREGGHSRRRIVRAQDLTGREVERALLEAVAAEPNVELLENALAVDLITTPAGGTGGPVCRGAWVLLPGADRPEPVRARAVVLASGGCGQVYLHTTNPGIATGDGVAMAFRAGAQVANMEFVQFHPTALYPTGRDTFLISEAVRGEGAVLRTRDGTPFMERYHPLGSLAPRDVVARAIDREMKRSGDPHVLLDCSSIPEREIRERFPNILRVTRARGIDMLAEPLPVVPAAHYACGGVLSDIHGRTTLPGLFAIGETAATGVHGANRLASNSLLEALVFAGRAAEVLTASLPAAATTGDESPEWTSGDEPLEGVVLVHDREEIRSLMWDLVGIVRSNERLRLARGRLHQMAAQHGRLRSRHLPTPELLELRNLLEVALLIVHCAEQRRESRGLHFNVDHPFRDNERFLRDTVVARGGLEREAGR